MVNGPFIGSVKFISFIFYRIFVDVRCKFIVLEFIACFKHKSLFAGLAMEGHAQTACFAGC